MTKDTSRKNFTTLVVTLLIIGSVLFSAVESVRVPTNNKRVKGEYRGKSLKAPFEMRSRHGLGSELETSTIIDLIGLRASVLRWFCCLLIDNRPMHCTRTLHLRITPGNVQMWGAVSTRMMMMVIQRVVELVLEDVSCLRTE